jgi:hypothetical protein
MFKQLTSWFRKRDEEPLKLAERPAAEAPLPAIKVETAPLSLAAILARFPADLKTSILRMPDPEVTVALPVTTIVKQLPTGAVKMSLASLHRQAPPGTFAPLRAEEKRMVEVPLVEIFKRVNVNALKRREDQRRLEVADGFDIFGDEENPYAIAPSVPEEQPRPIQMDEPGPAAHHFGGYVRANDRGSFAISHCSHEARRGALSHAEAGPAGGFRCAVHARAGCQPPPALQSRQFTRSPNVHRLRPRRPVRRWHPSSSRSPLSPSAGQTRFVRKWR